MADLIKSLTRLLALCPDITLTAKDIQEVIDSNGSFNACISTHKNGGVPVEVVEVVVEELEELEVPTSKFDEEEELADHLVECEDDECECKGVFDQIEPEND